MDIIDLRLLSTIPFSRINDRIPIHNTKVSKMFNDANLPILSIDNQTNSLDTRYQFLKLQESFVYVATETVFHYPCAFLSEKSFKGITAKRPFILVGAVGSLQKLHELGFKTFSEFWNESYDLEADPELRLIEIVKIINQIATYSISELKELLVAMDPILQYNFNYYKNLFYENELNKFKRSLTCLK